jgi:hypothetical protein
LSVTLKNRGRFSIDGYILRVHDRVGAELGIYTFDEEGFPLAPGEEVNLEYNFSDFDFEGYVLSDVTFIEVQPYVDGKGGVKVGCKTHSSHSVECS